MHTPKVVRLQSRHTNPANLGDILQQIAVLSPRTIEGFTVIARRILKNLKDRQQRAS